MAICKLSQVSKFIRCLRRDKLSQFSNGPEVQFVRTPDSEGDKDAWETVSNTRSVMALQTLIHRPHFVATWSMCVTCSYCSAAAHLCLSCFLQFVQFSHNAGRTSTILSNSKFYETFLEYQNRIIRISPVLINIRTIRTIDYLQQFSHINCWIYGSPTMRCAMCTQDILKFRTIVLSYILCLKVWAHIENRVRQGKVFFTLISLYQHIESIENNVNKCDLQLCNAPTLWCTHSQSKTNCILPALQVG